MKYVSHNMRKEDEEMVELVILAYKKTHGEQFSRANYTTECLLGWTRHILEKIGIKKEELETPGEKQTFHQREGVQLEENISTDTQSL